MTVSLTVVSSYLRDNGYNYSDCTKCAKWINCSPCQLSVNQTSIRVNSWQLGHTAAQAQDWSQQHYFYDSIGRQITTGRSRRNLYTNCLRDERTPLPWPYDIFCLLTHLLQAFCSLNAPKCICSQAPWTRCTRELIQHSPGSEHPPQKHQPCSRPLASHFRPSRFGHFGPSCLRLQLWGDSCLLGGRIDTPDVNPLHYQHTN